MAGVDVLVLGLMLPRMDGWKLIAAMRAQPARASNRVIVLSAAYDARKRQLSGARVLREPLCAERGHAFRSSSRWRGARSVDRRLQEMLAVDGRTHAASGSLR